MSNLPINVISEIPMLSPNNMTDMECIRSIEAYESRIESSPANIKINVNQFFGDGCYAREAVMPKGAIVTGRTHLYDHIIVMISGEMTVWSAGVGLKRISGPCVFEAKAGVKRIAYIHQDVRWVNLHGIHVEGRPSEDEMSEVLSKRHYGDFIKYISDLKRGILDGSIY